MPSQKEAKTMQTTYGEQHPHRGNPFAWAALAVVLVAVIALIAVLAFHGYPASPAGSYYGYPFFGWWFFFPFGIFFLLMVLFLVSRVVFWPMGGGWRRRYWYGYGDANEILRQRYARGEITKEQFDQMKRDLEQH
jgi:putative membrane protein